MRNQAGIFLIALFCLAISSVNQTFASDSSISAASANLSNKTGSNALEDIRGKVLSEYLKDKNSPFSDKADVFIKAADENNIDWRLLVAISGVESTFGQEIPYNSYNAWGYGIFEDNTRCFTSWDDAIDTISSDIRTKYMDEWHAENVDQIGRIYAAAPDWSVRVEKFIKEIDAYNIYFASNSLPISL